ncbi:MAG: nucleotide sugar dehydrogenase [SAR324 cluster bacterium]|nr:nucleotide sugar dehydrogenase [SAR324 cluster bacterium]
MNAIPKVNTIVCIGAGYVGGPTMAVIADHCPGVRVVVLDSNPERIAQWNSGRLPIFEPGLEAVVERCRGRNLFFEVSAPAPIAEADIVFVSVNTPTKEFGEGAGMAPDLRYWEQAARFIQPHLKDGAIVVEKSTVPVRTAEAISRILHLESGGRHFPVLSNPEFLAEGTAIRDLEAPDRVLIGCEDDDAGRAAAQALAGVYRNWVPPERIVLSSVWSSELSKLVANAFLAQRISSINAVSALCEATQADITEISRAVGTDRRIGLAFLESGVGFGGSCFRKDILSLSYLCQQQGLPEAAAYWRSVVEMNDHQINRFARNIVERQFNTVAGKKLAIFGFAFKPGTNDTRDSPAHYVCKKLLEEQAHLAIHDPQALDNARHDLRGLEGNIAFEHDPYRAAQGAHAVVLITHWEEYRKLDYRRIHQSMEKPASVFDGRNWLDSAELHRIGFNVYPIGKTPLIHE